MSTTPVISGAASTASTTSSSNTLSSALNKAMTGDDFLKLFTTELQNQNPMDPMNNTEMMQQISQMSSLQMTSDMSANLHSMFAQNSLLQASGMIGKNITYDNGTTMLSAIVTQVSVDDKGAVQLNLDNGLTTGLDKVNGIL